MRSNQNAFAFPLPHLLFTIVLTLFLFSGGSPVFAELPSDLAQGIGILSEYKSNAEQQARILVGLAAEEDISKDDYRKGQSLYAQAKAAFDGWIDQLVFEIQSGKTALLSPQYETVKEAAKAKGDTFTKYVQEQFLGKSRRGEVADVFKSLFASITDVGRAVKNGFSQASAPDQAQAIKKLEAYKWSPFHVIEQSL